MYSQVAFGTIKCKKMNVEDAEHFKGEMQKRSNLSRRLSRRD